MFLRKYLFTIVFILSLISIFPESAKEESKVNALDILKSGNERYVNGVREFANLSKERMKNVVDKGQHPYAVVLTCSDSRVPPEHIFDCGIGDIFVIRVAGNVADIDEIATIEYGVEHLHSPLLVVLGHSNCGAVTAVIKKDKVGGSLPLLVDNIVPAADKALKKYNTVDNTSINYAINENIWQSIEDVYKNSSIVKELVEEKELKVVGAYYNLKDGKVEWLGTHPEESKLLESKESSKKESNILLIFINLLILFVCLLVTFHLIVSSKSRLLKLNIKNRITVSITALVLFVFISFVINNIFFGVKFSTAEKIINLSLIFLLTVIFTVIYINEIISLFRKYISSVKNRVDE